MSFKVRTDKRATGNSLDGTFIILEETESGARAEIWPAHGFNCIGWQTRRDGKPAEILYQAPTLFEEFHPTRSGIPVLFPFPNRIREGKFTWDKQSYRLPLIDPAKKNGIHGFACRVPWRIIDQGANQQNAWVTGEFWAREDAPEVLSLWPADHRIRLTYALTESCLSLEAIVDNPDKKILPFGLGYHPFFCLPPPPEETLVWTGARKYWELSDSLPTGNRLPCDKIRDLTTPKPYAQLQLDEVLTDLPEADDNIRAIGSIQGGQGGQHLLLNASNNFRELVVFTPPHREAICLEPYSCTTDAINLYDREIDSGWYLLEPGKSWQANVELAVE